MKDPIIEPFNRKTTVTLSDAYEINNFILQTFDSELCG
jgi:hypothetical protein